MSKNFRGNLVLGQASSDNVTAPAVKTETPPSPSNETAVTATDEMIRVMIIMNKQSSFNSTLSFLNRRGYQITMAHTIADTIKKLLIVKPKVILISWNLKNADVRKIHTLITEKFKILCIAFAEDNSTKTAAALMNSGFQHTILPPVSGPTIHMRIQNLLRRKKEIGSSKPQGESFNYGKSEKDRERDHDEINEVTAQEIGGDTVWSQTESSSDLPSEQTTWKGISKSSNKVYYFKGPKAPSYDSTKQEWDVTGKNGPIFSQSVTLSQMMSALQESKKGKDYSLQQEGQGLEGGDDSSYSDETEVDWEGGLQAAQKELGDLESALQEQFSENDFTPEEKEYDPLEDLPIDSELEVSEEDFDFPLNEEENQGLADDLEAALNPGAPPRKAVQKKQARASHSILAQSVKASVEQSFGPIMKESISLGKIKKFSCLLIESNQFKGYLICVTSDNEAGTKKITAFGERVSAKMKQYGTPLKPMKQIIEFALSPNDFMSWCRRGEFYFLAQNENFDAGFCFISVPQLPQLIEDQNPDVLSVTLDKDLIPDEILLFDLFLHMPKNDKFILYLSKGTVLPLKTIQKLMKFGVKNVYIKNSESLLFMIYSAKCFIQRKIS